MSAQTESLIKELLENPITVAIYGGGFKPPTKGHYLVVEKTLEQFPEIDELKIFVGGGVRDGITQEESIKIWEIYKPSLSDKIDIEPSVAPVKSILGYAKEHPEEKVYWILGAREGDEDDLKDIENRTKSISKYPNIEVKVITTSGGVSGTKTRAAIKSDNKEQFFHMIPDVEQKEEIWNILSPIIKENLVDNVKSKLNNFIQAVKQEGKETKQAFSLLLKAAKGDIDLTDEQNQFIKEQMVDLLKSLGLVTIAVMPAGSLVALLLKTLKLSPYITPSAFMDKMKEASDPQAGTALPHGSGFAPIKEIYQFKVSDKNYDEEDNSLISVDYEFSTPDNDYRVEFHSGEYNPEAKTFDVSFGLDKYGSKLDTFQMTGEGNALSILKTIVDIIKDFTNRFEVNKLVIDPTSEKRGKVYSMILKALPQDILNKVKLVKETKSDPFGLNEIAKELGTQVGKDLTKGWNPKKDFLSLSVFMRDNGMNVTPLPKIKVISDDKENASRLLGKTAYYNPADKSITLYTFGRHPKDVLRSFAHEMVHHEQNLNGTLGNIGTTNTNEDGHLDEIEREAYEKGNIMLRNWEDSIKNV